MAQTYRLPEQPISITRRNVWLHGDDAIGARVAELFARNIEVQDDGSYAICLGQQRHAIAVADAAYVVRHLHHESAAAPMPPAIRLHLSDGQSELLDASTLMQSADHVLYCRLRRGKFLVPCRFTAQQYHALALMGEWDVDGFYLLLGPQRHRLAAYDPRPLPLADAPVSGRGQKARQQVGA